MLYPVAILAGGLATRLYPVTEKIPKALLDVGGKPFIEHQLCLLSQRGFRRAVICAWYLGEKIRDFVGDGNRFGLQVDFVFDGSKPLGTAGALRHALPLLGDTFFVLYGDSYLLCDYLAVQNSFWKQGKPGLMTVFRNSGQWDASNVEFCNGLILAYNKKDQSPAMEHIDYGLGVFQAEVFAALPEGRNLDLAEVYQDLLHRGALAAYEMEERFYEIGSREGLQELDRLLGGKSRVISEKDEG